MTNSSSDKVNINPDEPCFICGLARVDHGDARHEWSADGKITIKPEPAPAREQAPQPRSTARRESSAAEVLGSDPVARLSLKLITRLVDKGLLDGDDLLYIMGGR